MHIEIPAGTKQIKARAYEDMRSLESIKIPDSVEEIGDGAFSGCDFLKELVIPESVRRIGRNLCSECTGLKRFGMYGKAKFDTSWLNGCRHLEEVILSEASGVRVWNGAVYNTDLTELIFVPSGLKHLILPVTVREAKISAKIQELSCYQHQELAIDCNTSLKLHFYTEQKRYFVYVPSSEEIEETEEIYFFNVLEHEKLMQDVLTVLQTGEFPEDFGRAVLETEFWSEEYILPLFALRFELAEITADLYQKDITEICRKQIEMIAADMKEHLTEEDICEELNNFFCNHMNDLFCLDAFPEWKEEVIREFIRCKSFEIIKNILEKYRFTEEEVMMMLKAANAFQKYEIQIMIMQYRQEHFGNTDIADKLKL